MLTVISVFQPKRAGRLFVHKVILSTSFEPFARCYFRSSLAIFKTPLNAIIFIVIVFIQLALNTYGYFKNNNGQKAYDRKNTNRSSRTQPDPERLEADVPVDEEDREDSLGEGSSRHIYSVSTISYFSRTSDLTASVAVPGVATGNISLHTLCDLITS
ncbi:hypothetical protein P692DRAFT_20542370 [Suillus brevipes Sb2]|nr:hypothetical protein P692DRAFT_20542370 [Suillus brevipes Sb2]